MDNCLKRIVSQMVYCNLIENKRKSAVYAFGASVDDMTGIIEFYDGLRMPNMIKQPKKTAVKLSDAFRIVIKYKRQFETSAYPERVSYES